MATNSPCLIRKSEILSVPLDVVNDKGRGGDDDCGGGGDEEEEAEEVEEEATVVVLALACEVDDSVEGAVNSCPGASPCPVASPCSGACIATGGAVHEKVPPSMVMAYPPAFSDSPCSRCT